MKCMKCKINDATIYYEENINGVINKFALCPNCANYEGIGSDNIIKGFNLMTEFYDINQFSHGNKNVQNTCPYCGSTFEEIIHSGMMGCPKCYSVFESELRPTLRRIHGNAVHVGRKPYKNNVNNKDSNSFKLDKLRDELNDAIIAEEYEKAAEIRDLIREEENRGEVNG